MNVVYIHVPLFVSEPYLCLLTLLSGIKRINYLALDCSINTKKSLVSPQPTFYNSAISRRTSKEVAELYAAGTQ